MVQADEQDYADDLFSLPVDENRDGDFTLPAPERANLSEVNEAVVKAAMDDEDWLAKYVVAEDYINKLLPIFQECEDMDLCEELLTLRSILLTLINLYEPPIMECILKDSNFVGCIGMLEYAAKKDGGEANYRQAYQQKANFRKLVAIADPEVELKLRQVFRIHFLKDFALARCMEESLMSTLESLVQPNIVGLHKYLQMDRAFLKDIFETVKDPAATRDRKNDIVQFVYQFCTMVEKTGGVILRYWYFHWRSGLVRSQIVKQAMDKCHKPLLGLIIQRFLVEADNELITQFAKIIWALLNTDPSMPDASWPDRDADKFLDLFFSQHCTSLVASVLERARTRLDRSASARCSCVYQLILLSSQKYPAHITNDTWAYQESYDDAPQTTHEEDNEDQEDDNDDYGEAEYFWDKEPAEDEEEETVYGGGEEPREFCYDDEDDDCVFLNGELEGGVHSHTGSRLLFDYFRHNLCLLESSAPVQEHEYLQAESELQGDCPEPDETEYKGEFPDDQNTDYEQAIVTDMLNIYSQQEGELEDSGAEPHEMEFNDEYPEE
ncbi:Platinum sensitivity protein [Mortierella sp. GBA35]|nr:Platinum sensitivity protein [Mortierella sp. GBA35]